MTKKNTLKRLLMYIVVLVGIVFVAFMAFYFARNDETIALTVEEGDVIYMNEGDAIALPIEHTDPYRGTTIAVASSDATIATYISSTNTISAVKGGSVTITVTPSNANFGPFRFDVVVGDGTTENPWFVTTAKQLASIGKIAESGEREYTAYASYEILNDIDLSSTYTENTFWSPINQFYGTISGEGHTISNLKIESSLANVGMFGILDSNARVENLILKNAMVTANGSAYVGTIAGINYGFIGKVAVNSTITSTSNTAYVGSVVGANIYNGSRPTLNAVSTVSSITALGNVGGITGENIGGIIFNCSVEISSLNVYDIPTEQPVPESQRMAAVENPIITDTDYLNYTMSFGGVTAYNSALLYNNGTDIDFRQAGIKNVFVLINADTLIARNPLFINNISMVASINNEIGIEDHNYAVKNVFVNIFAQTYQTASAIQIAENADISKIYILTTAQMADTNTFTALGSSWTYNTTLKRPVLSISGSYESSLISDPGKTLSTSSEVVDAFKTIVTNISKTLSFTVDATNATNHEVVVDANDIMTALNITEWSPIGTAANPYKGQLIAINGNLVITNLTITNSSADNIGLFGFVSGPNTLLQNIILRNVKITNSSLAATGALVGYLESGTISNIAIDNITIENAAVAGFAVGYNKGGKIENVTVGSHFADADENTIKNSTFASAEIVYGGIAGISEGYINNASVENASLDNKTLTSGYFGGIVGKLGKLAQIYNGFNKGCEINSLSTVGYYGGVVAYMASTSRVDLSYMQSKITTVISETDQDSYAGGIAAYVAENATIYGSFSNATGIKAKNVGGIASLNHGLIRESYSLGSYTGFNVGGLTYETTGEIIHSYTRAALDSIATSNNYAVAGISVLIPEGGKVSYVYSNAIIVASTGASKFAETASYVRYNDFEELINSWWGKQKAGSLSHYICVGYGTAVIQQSAWDNQFGVTPSDFIQTDEDSVKGLGATNPFDQAGFQNYTPQYWIFPDGEWPTLTNVVAMPESNA